MRAGNEGAGSAQRAAWLFELLSELIAPIMTTIIPKYERKRPKWRPCFQTGRAFLETSMDPTWQDPREGNFFEWGSGDAWVGILRSRASRGYAGHLRGLQ